jgi:hypothetical protein
VVALVALPARDQRSAVLRPEPAAA